MTQFRAPHSTETLVKLLQAMADQAKGKENVVVLREAAERLSNLDQQVGILQTDKQHWMDEWRAKTWKKPLDETANSKMPDSSRPNRK